MPTIKDDVLKELFSFLNEDYSMGGDSLLEELASRQFSFAFFDLMVKYGTYQMKYDLAQNPHIPLEALEHIVDLDIADKDMEISTFGVLANPICTPNLIVKIWNNEIKDSTIVAIYNHEKTPEWLKATIQTKYPEVL